MNDHGGGGERNPTAPASSVLSCPCAAAPIPIASDPIRSDPTPHSLLFHRRAALVDGSQRHDGRAELTALQPAPWALGRVQHIPGRPTQSASACPCAVPVAVQVQSGAAVATDAPCSPTQRPLASGLDGRCGPASPCRPSTHKSDASSLHAAQQQQQVCRRTIHPSCSSRGPDQRSSVVTAIVTGRFRRLKPAQSSGPLTVPLAVGVTVPTHTGCAHAPSFAPRLCSAL